MLLTGIKTSENKKTYSEFSLLSWIPLLGELFKYENITDDKTTFTVLIENIDINSTI